MYEHYIHAKFILVILFKKDDFGKRFILILLYFDCYFSDFIKSLST